MELNRIYLGLDRIDNVNAHRYHATEGTALLSRYPIANAEVLMPITGLRFMLYPVSYYKNYHDPHEHRYPAGAAEPGVGAVCFRGGVSLH